MEMSGSVVSRRVSERWLAHALFEVGEALAVLHVLAGEDSAPVPQSWKAGLTISLRPRAGRAGLVPRRAVFLSSRPCARSRYERHFASDGAIKAFDLIWLSYSLAAKFGELEWW